MSHDMLYPAQLCRKAIRASRPGLYSQSETFATKQQTTPPPHSRQHRKSVIQMCHLSSKLSSREKFYAGGAYEMTQIPL